ncbi:TPA: hypothetical protein MYP03_003432 [Citrobacter freundii]|nr:hypothetical protein [Citrobacter freundii]
MTIAERLKQEGHHNGLQQGIQQGLAQGVQKGTQEEALRIARMMLENGIDRDLVRLITGLLPDDVTAARQSKRDTLTTNIGSRL